MRPRRSSVSARDDRVIRPADPPEDDWLDDEFPLGDGTAQTDVDVVCPYCGADVEVVLDPGGGSMQRYVEDCEVCCRPWTVHVEWDAEGAAAVRLTTQDDPD